MTHGPMSLYARVAQFLRKKKKTVIAQVCMSNTNKCGLQKQNWSCSFQYNRHMIRQATFPLFGNFTKNKFLDFFSQRKSVCNIQHLFWIRAKHSTRKCLFFCILNNLKSKKNPFFFVCSVSIFSVSIRSMTKSRNGAGTEPSILKHGTEQIKSGTKWLHS
jgi:hypothetical protein